MREVLQDPGFTISCDASNPIQVVGRTGQYYVAGRGRTGQTIRLANVPNATWLDNGGPHRFGLMAEDANGDLREMCGSDIQRLVATSQMFGTSALARTPLLSLEDLIDKKSSDGRLSRKRPLTTTESQA